MIIVYCDFTLTSCFVKQSSYIKRRFCTIGFQNFSVPENLSAYDGLEFRLKGDGRRYKIIVRTSTDWDTVGYTSGFDTEKGKWQSVGIIHCNCCSLYYVIRSQVFCYFFLFHRFKCHFLPWGQYFEQELCLMLHHLIQVLLYHYRYGFDSIPLCLLA